MPPEQREAVKDHLVRVKRFPARWLDRLNDGIARGLFWDHSEDRIVEFMLMGPR
jgi:hypothetical protein